MNVWATFYEIYKRKKEIVIEFCHKTKRFCHKMVTKYYCDRENPNILPIRSSYSCPLIFLYNVLKTVRFYCINIYWANYACLKQGYQFHFDMCFVFSIEIKCFSFEMFRRVVSGCTIYIYIYIYIYIFNQHNSNSR